MRIFLQVLLWLLPFINYAWSLILDQFIQYIDLGSGKDIRMINDTPFLCNIVLFLSFLVVLYLYCYLFFVHEFKLYYKLITIIAVIIHLLIHVFMYTFNTIHIHDYNNCFPVSHFFYSLLYFIPFYIIAFILFRKLRYDNIKVDKTLS